MRMKVLQTAQRKVTAFYQRSNKIMEQPLHLPWSDVIKNVHQLFMLSKSLTLCNIVLHMVGFFLNME